MTHPIFTFLPYHEDGVYYADFTHYELLRHLRHFISKLSHIEDFEDEIITEILLPSTRVASICYTYALQEVEGSSSRRESNENMGGVGGCSCIPGSITLTARRELAEVSQIC